MHGAQQSEVDRVDLVLTNGRIWTGHGDDDYVEAVAVRDGAIVAVGTSNELADFADDAAEVIDLDGRFVMAGLNDSHIHAVRAGISWAQTLHWEELDSKAAALAQIAERAAALPEGAWISAIGGWSRRQFVEGTAPTRAELDEAAPGHPVFLQELYDHGWLNSAALAALGWDDTSADPPGGVLVREDGRLTGEVLGMGAFAAAIALALPPDEEAAVAGTRRMFDEYAQHGLTGVVDGGGFLISPISYRPLYQVWRDRTLSVRTRLFMSAWERSAEVENMRDFTSLSAADFGDGILQMSGIGELVHYGCHDMEGLTPFTFEDQPYAELVEIIRTAISGNWRVSVHAVRDDTLTRVLDAFEEVDAGTGIVGRLHCSIVHADEASQRNLERMSRLGMGVLVQNRLLLKGTDYERGWGSDQTKQTPPIGAMRALGLPIGAGTDATRANWYLPWPSIAWLVTGSRIDGGEPRATEHLMSVADALRSYTTGSAWFTDEQDHRGRIEVGFDADFCVPTADPFAVATERLGSLRSDLTIMGGRITHDTGALTRTGRRAQLAEAAS